MTGPDVKALRELLDRAVPVPWELCSDPPNSQWHKGRTIGAASDRDARRVCDVFALGVPEPGSVWAANGELIVAAINALPELLRVYEAWQGAAETTMTEGDVPETGEPCAETIDCFDVALIGQRVKLVPVEGVAK